VRRVSFNKTSLTGPGNNPVGRLWLSRHYQGTNREDDVSSTSGGECLRVVNAGPDIEVDEYSMVSQKRNSTTTTEAG